jgi:hypothetical protein
VRALEAGLLIACIKVSSLRKPEISKSGLCFSAVQALLSQYLPSHCILYLRYIAHGQVIVLIVK